MGFLAAAFIFVWLLVAGYVVFIGLRQRRLMQELRTLEEILNEQK